MLKSTSKVLFSTISSPYGGGLGRRVLDGILHVVDQVKCLDNEYNRFIALLINRYNDRLFLLLRQFLLVPRRIKKFMELRTNCAKFCFNKFY